MVEAQTAQFPKETDVKGRFVRQQSKFRNWISNDANAQFPAVANRYHLYVSLACPWAHRTIIFRKLKGLEAIISMTIVDPIRDSQGWKFTDDADPNEDFQFLSEAYKRSDPDFDGRVTVPVLWDKEQRVIVNNESSEIIRMLNSAFNDLTGNTLDFYPEAQRAKIDEINERVYHNVNNGVYRSGFASTQEAYDEAIDSLFETLDWLESHLSANRYLAGETLTEADWRLFTTLVRFDPVYVTHFKTNLKRLVDYPNLWAYTRELYQMNGIAETVDLDHIKRHYFVTHRTINPLGIVPKGPQIHWLEPHGRGA